MTRCRHVRAIIASAGDLEACLGCALVRSRSGRRVHPWREATPAERDAAAMLRRGHSPGPGRPPLPPGEARDVELRVRVTSADLAALDAHAKRLGVGRSEAVRRAIGVAIDTGTTSREIAAVRDRGDLVTTRWGSDVIDEMRRATTPREPSTP